MKITSPPIFTIDPASYSEWRFAVKWFDDKLEDYRRLCSPLLSSEELFKRIAN
jgi:hypothetical protein